jgi:hypothetical protein
MDVIEVMHWYGSVYRFELGRCGVLASVAWDIKIPSGFFQGLDEREVLFSPH